MFFWPSSDTIPVDHLRNCSYPSMRRTALPVYGEVHRISIMSFFYLACDLPPHETGQSLPVGKRSRIASVMDAARSLSLHSVVTLEVEIVSGRFRRRTLEGRTGKTSVQCDYSTRVALRVSAVPGSGRSTLGILQKRTRVWGWKSGHLTNQTRQRSRAAPGTVRGSRRSHSSEGKEPRIWSLEG